MVRHATWFVGAVEKFGFFDLKVYPFADPEAAVAEVKAEGLIKSTGRIYRQDYVVFLRAANSKIAFLREYFDPVQARDQRRSSSKISCSTGTVAGSRERFHSE